MREIDKENSFFIKRAHNRKEKEIDINEYLESIDIDINKIKERINTNVFFGQLYSAAIVADLGYELDDEEVVYFKGLIATLWNEYLDLEDQLDELVAERHEADVEYAYTHC